MVVAGAVISGLPGFGQIEFYDLAIACLRASIRQLSAGLSVDQMIISFRYEP